MLCYLCKLKQRQYNDSKELFINNMYCGGDGVREPAVCTNDR